MTRDGAIAVVSARMYRPLPVPGEATRRWAAELLDELEPYLHTRAAARSIQEEMTGTAGGPLTIADFEAERVWRETRTTTTC